MKRHCYWASLVLSIASSHSFAACRDITFESLNAAVQKAASQGKSSGGYGLPLWATVVDETGAVCWVTTSGTPGATAGNMAWLGGRLSSVQKANTANAFSLDGYATSTANLYSASQPGGSLFGLQDSNPLNAAVAYAGNPSFYGTSKDPLKGKRMGGILMLGGGLALYQGTKKVGALGVSGDTSCRDHALAWLIRTALNLVPAGVGTTTVNFNAAGIQQTPLAGAKVGDEMIIGTPNDVESSYWNSWAQPGCPNSVDAIKVPSNGTLTTLK
ncbi:MAG: heme-binding protein [Methylococcus sp.]|nr:MAG: heme-binding protein [Methylococcus sp.]